MATFQRCTAVSLGLVCLLAFVADVALAKKKGPYTIVPAVGAETEMGAGVEIVRVHRPEVTGEFSYVTGIARRRMMQATLGIDFDPFAAPAGEEPRFHTFLIYLHNQSAHDLFLNPTLAMILTDKNDPMYALEYSHLYQTVGRAAGLDLEEIQKVVYDRPITLGPGRKVKKLLVFPRFQGRKRWKQFQLSVTMERDGRTAIDMSVRFRRVYLNED